VDRFNSVRWIIALAVFYKLTLVAWYEELFFRGYILQNFIEGMGLKWTIVVTSLLFGLVHIFNPDATLFSSFLIAVITPQLIYAYLKTGQLWLPIGIHLGWNFFQASVFGFASSGQVSPSLISQTPIGLAWLSGGEFGAEASVLIIPFTILSCVLIHYGVRATRQPGQRFFETMR
jgi:membrane protease YdiL (CAAX protease family)